MNITGDQLVNQYERALKAWPFIVDYEHKYSLPAFTLFGVGSRETNLTNEVGDGGHGHGVWQLDNRSHTIPPGFDGNVREQCDTAGSMLHGLLRTFGGDLRSALAAYNAGADTVAYNRSHGLNVDSGTAGGDYSLDTSNRIYYLQRTIGHTLAPKPTPRPAPSHRTYTVKSGDTLWGIAQHYYGNGNLYTRIETANHLANPNVIKIGQTLVIP